MIKRLRKRMILASMAAFFAVIALVAILVNVVNYCVVTNRTDNTIRSIMVFEENTFDVMNPEKPPMAPFMALPNEELNYMTRFFIVRFDRKGNFSSSAMDYIASVNQNGAQKYGMKVYKRKADHGYIGEYRYLKKNVGDGTVIVFLNVFRELQFMKTLMFLTVLVSLVSLLLVFVLGVLISKRAIRPIEKNINMQKQFITDASHELKTPLTSINTSMDVITMEHGEDEWSENIKKQTERMSKLVSELVTLSRLDEEMPLPDKEAFSLSNAAWEVAEVYKPQAKALDKKFDIDIEDNISITGDKNSVCRMISVLLDNAVRYSDEKGDIRLNVYRKNSKAVVSVFNTCSYETPPDTKKLFDRFYRPDSSRDTKTGGSGVGLAIAKSVVEAHGGKISAACPSGKTMTIKAVL